MSNQNLVQNLEPIKDKEDPYILKMAACQAPNCKFSILSQNEDEIVEVVHGHALKFHNHDVPSDAIKQNLQTI